MLLKKHILLSFASLTLFTPPTRASPSHKESWSQLRGLSWPALFGRGSCSGTTCGWSGQLCCASGEACYTDSNDQAQCSKTTTTTATTASADSGYWHYYTTVYTETDLVTVTSTYSSSWCATTAVATTWATATATAAITCNYDEDETSCGSICCASGQYCYVSGQCEAVAASGSSYYSSSYWTSTASASAALRPTSSTDVVVTATNSPTTTVPYISPVATGANITLTGGASDNASGLSGGAIAGIVIGTLVGAFFLLLLCLYCCCAGFWAACCGRGRRSERDEYYESHRHRSGSGAAPAAGRSGWYGYGSRPARVETGREREGGLFKEGLGIAAILAGIAAALGLKRRHDRRRNDEKSDVSGNTYSYYTSESSASTEVRDTRRPSRSRR